MDWEWKFQILQNVLTLNDRTCWDLYYLYHHYYYSGYKSFFFNFSLFFALFLALARSKRIIIFYWEFRLRRIKQISGWKSTEYFLHCALSLRYIRPIVVITMKIAETRANIKTKLPPIKVTQFVHMLMLRKLQMKCGG